MKFNFLLNVGGSLVQFYILYFFFSYYFLCNLQTVNNDFQISFSCIWFENFKRLKICGWYYQNMKSWYSCLWFLQDVTSYLRTICYNFWNFQRIYFAFFFYLYRVNKWITMKVLCSLVMKIALKSERYANDIVLVLENENKSYYIYLYKDLVRI